MASFHIRHPALSILALLALFTCGCAGIFDLSAIDSHDTDTPKVSQQEARGSESCLEAVLKDTPPIAQKPTACTPTKLQGKVDLYKVPALAPAALEADSTYAYTAEGLQHRGEKKGARPLIEPSVNRNLRVKASIINGKLQLARRLPNPMLRGRKPDVAGKLPPGRIDDVLLDPGVTRAALETMLSDWGESTVKVDDTLVQHVIYFLKCFALCEREGTNTTLERSKKYLPQIKQVFAKHRLPEELAFAIPFVESRFTETAQSSAGAVGMFQFLAPTARDYGVAVTCDLPGADNTGIDERLDWNKTCGAAAQYLSEHRRMFHSVLLALGAYHHGATTVSKVLEAISGEDKEKPFRSIFMCDRLEAYSREYIPLCIAAAYLYRLVKATAASPMPNLAVHYVSIKKPTPLNELSAQHRDLTANNPDLAFADQLYCYASTGGYLLITELNSRSPKHVSLQLRPLTIAHCKP